MLPLERLIVIAVEQAVAAPFCSSRLADAGAHVIKVERPEGDFARGYDAAAKGQSSYFVWLNRGKNSVVIDLATKEGRQSLEQLIASADVFLQNLKPGSMDKLGFSLDRLKKDYPSLICCTISGYGDDGPYAQRKAYDLLIQAESGLASITGGPEGPSRVGMSIVDVATGATAHAAILEALIARGRTGKGADIRISMFDVMADWMAVPLINSEAGNPPKRMALAHPSIAPYGVFSSKDGKGILISIQDAGIIGTSLVMLVLLIAAGERHISSSLAGILVASAPIFTALLAIWVDQAERSHGFSLAGVVIGMVGVVVLLGVDAGRKAFVAGRMPRRDEAAASSPTEGISRRS